MTATLTVEPKTMRDAAAGLSDAANQVHGSQAGLAVSAAAGPNTGLAMGSVCAQVGSSLRQQAIALGNDASTFSDKLRAAADRYERGDTEAAEDIDFAGPVEAPPPEAHPPVSSYEKSLRNAGLLTGPARSRYEQWLENASKNGVPPATIVDIARTQDIDPEDFGVLDDMEEVNDRDGKSFFIIPSGTSAGDVKKAVLMTYVLNAGSDYAQSDPTGQSNDYAETPYSANEVQRIIDRQGANSWSYTALSTTGRGASVASTPNGMLMGVGGPVIDLVSVRGGTTYGDVFTLNVDGMQDPHEVLAGVIQSGQRWSQIDGGAPRPTDLELDRLLHHEEMHAEQWADKGFATMARDYGLAAIIEHETGVNPLERDAGLSDGGYHR